MTAPRIARPSALALATALALGLGLGLGGCRTPGPSDAAVENFRQAVIAARAGDFDEAERLALLAREEEPRLLDVHMLLARIAEERGAYEDAREHYQAVLAVDPKHTNAEVAIGLTYLEEERPQDAEAWFRRAVDRDPKHEPAVFNLAALLEEKGEAAEAADLYLRSADLSEHDKPPRDPRPLIVASKLLLDLGRQDDAAEAARRAIERLDEFLDPPQGLVDEAQRLLAEAESTS